MNDKCVIPSNHQLADFLDHLGAAFARGEYPDDASHTRRLKLWDAATALRMSSPVETTVARTPCDDCLADRNRLSAELKQYKAWHRGGRSNVEFLGDGVRVCNGEHENHEPCQFVEYRRAEESRESADLRHKLAAVLEPHACLPGRVQVIAGKSDTFWSIVQALAGSSMEPSRRLPTNVDVDYVLQVYKPEVGPDRQYVYVDSPTVPGLHCMAETAGKALSVAPAQVAQLRRDNGSVHGSGGEVNHGSVTTTGVPRSPLPPCHDTDGCPFDDDCPEGCRHPPLNGGTPVHD